MSYNDKVQFNIDTGEIQKSKDDLIIDALLSIKKELKTLTADNKVKRDATKKLELRQPFSSYDDLKTIKRKEKIYTLDAKTKRIIEKGYRDIQLEINAGKTLTLREMINKGIPIDNSVSPTFSDMTNMPKNLVDARNQLVDLKALKSITDIKVKNELSALNAQIKLFEKQEKDIQEKESKKVPTNGE